jgi:hypothetical protein
MRVINIAILFALAFTACQSESDQFGSQDNVASNQSVSEPSSRPTPLAADMNSPNLHTPTKGTTRPYIGCWNGMGGGQLEITSKSIHDRGSGEKSHYKEAFGPKRAPEGLQTGEEYLLVMNRDFPKSFLSKVIDLAYNSDGTVGIVAYDSYDDYLKNSFVGQGLFEKVPCN